MKHIKENISVCKGNRTSMQEVHFTNPMNEFVGTVKIPSDDGEAKNLAQVLNDIKTRIDGVNPSIRFLPKYLRYLEFNDSYPTDAEWYYEQAETSGYCSARRRGNILERNYDWYFDESCEFVVSMTRGKNDDGTTRYASIGVASCGKKITESSASSGEWSRFYKCLPGMTLDGMNENGVAAEINVVPMNGSSWERRLDGDGRNLNGLGGVRWILDHCTNAEDAAEYIAEHAYMPNALSKMGYALHFMICDRESTWIVEDGIANNIEVALNGKDAIMTNFRLFTSDGRYFTDSETREPFGSGYERYDILSESDSSIMDVWYKKAYDWNEETKTYPWPTEFAGCVMPETDENPNPQPITSDDIEGLNEWAVTVINGNKPSREKGTYWQTVHSSIYDLENLTLKVAVQENDDWYVFGIQSQKEAENGDSAESKRNATDFSVWKKVSDNWYWTSAETYSSTIPSDAETNREISSIDSAPIYHMVECPQEFLDFANSANAPKLKWHSETNEWGNVNMFHPNGKPKYVITLKTAPKNQSSITFYFFVVDENGVDTGEMFGAVATRDNADDDSIYSIGGDDMPLGENEFPRIATTDYVDRFYSRKKRNDADIKRRIDQANDIESLKTIMKELI